MKTEPCKQLTSEARLSSDSDFLHDHTFEWEYG